MRGGCSSNSLLTWMNLVVLVMIVVVKQESRDIEWLQTARETVGKASLVVMIVQTAR